MRIKLLIIPNSHCPSSIRASKTSIVPEQLLKIWIYMRLDASWWSRYVKPLQLRAQREGCPTSSFQWFILMNKLLLVDSSVSKTSGYGSNLGYQSTGLTWFDHLLWRAIHASIGIRNFEPAMRKCLSQELPAFNWTWLSYQNYNMKPAARSTLKMQIKSLCTHWLVGSQF